MKILITGVSGFIGSNIAKKMLDEGYDVTGISRRNIQERIPGIRNICADISKGINIDEKFDVIIHCAGQVLHSNTISYIDNTIVTAKNTIKFGETCDAKCIINASSITVYGEVESIVNERTGFSNCETYGLAKILVERMIEDSIIPHRINLRIPKVLGKGLEYSIPWIPKLTYNLIKGNTINYFNPYLQYNDLIHISDLVDYYAKLISKLDLLPEYDVIGLGTTDFMTIKEILDLLYEETNSKSILRVAEPNGKNTCFAIDVSKAVSLGFKSKPIREVLRLFAKEACEDLK